MLLSPWKNGLTSLFKEVRVFKVYLGSSCAWTPSLFQAANVANYGCMCTFGSEESASHLSFTVGTKIIVDPEKCVQELISEKLLILLRDRPCLQLIIVSRNFRALLFLQGKLLESV